jgi:hypothetical protein
VSSNEGIFTKPLEENNINQSHEDDLKKEDL